jgi:hypothetical protein
MVQLERQEWLRKGRKLRAARAVTFSYFMDGKSSPLCKNSHLLVIYHHDDVARAFVADTSVNNVTTDAGRSK